MKKLFVSLVFVNLACGMWAVSTPLAATPTTLYATVGSGSSIALTTGTGVRVRRLKAGRYRFIVSDKSGKQNFALKGPRVSRRTTVSYVGSQTWTVRLFKGRYRYLCEAHPKTMSRSLVVY